MPPSPKYARRYAKFKKGIGIVPEGLFRWISKRSLRKQVLAESALASAEDVQFWVEFFNWEFDSGKMNKNLLLATSDVLIDYFSNYSFAPGDLHDWNGKILVIESDKDKVIDPDERAKFKQIYSQGEIFVQEGSGHFGEGLLKPEKSIIEIKRFLSQD